MTTQDGLERRVAALEQMARHYSNMRAEETRLVTGVERLADETGGLNIILNKVDEQQQRLSRLGRDLERVEKSKISKEELESTKRQQKIEALEFRKRTLTRIYTTGLILAFSLLAGAGLLAWYGDQKRAAQFEVCEARNKQNQIIVDILRGSIKNVPPSRATSPEVANIQRGIERFDDLIIDCASAR